MADLGTAIAMGVFDLDIEFRMLSGGGQDGIAQDDGEGVVGAPLSKYIRSHTRICRPIGLTPDDCHRVCAYAMERIGFDYDVKNIIDLLR